MPLLLALAIKAAKVAELALKVAQITKAGIEAGRDMKEYWEAGQAMLARIKAEDREPTDEEWAFAKAENDANSAAIQGS